MTAARHTRLGLAPLEGSEAGRLPALPAAGARRLAAPGAKGGRGGAGPEVRVVFRNGAAFGGRFKEDKRQHLEFVIDAMSLLS